MKKIFFALFGLVLLSAVTNLNAQDLKFGHIESQRVVLLMPEYMQAGDSIKLVQTQYVEQMEKMQVEINRKINEFNETQHLMDSLIMISMATEVEGMRERLKNFEVQVQNKLQNLEGALLQDVMGKLEGAIKEVAIELDLIYVFDMSARNPIYASDKSIDISPMVKEKLGIQ